MYKLDRSRNKCTCEVICVRKVQTYAMGLNMIKVYIMCIYEDVIMKPIHIYNSYMLLKAQNRVFSQMIC